MTDREKALYEGPLADLYFNPPLQLYRLARAKYANLSGIGAALYPGRWNEPGVEAIYTSVERSATMLERLVHTPKDQIPCNLALMTIELGGGWRSIGQGMRIEEHTGAAMLTYPSLAAAEADFLAGRFQGVLAIALPSVIVPVWNLVLYPDSTGFQELVSLKEVERFEFDSRLFPEDATSEFTDDRYKE